MPGQGFRHASPISRRQGTGSYVPANPFCYAYDATDELLWKGPNANGSGSSAFSYDALGNLLSSQPSGPDSGSLKPTTYTYDPAGHLLTIDDGTAAQKVTFTIDAAGRHASEVIGSGATTTYEYLGTSDVISSETTSGVTTYSGIDAIGDRLSQGSGASVAGWLIADLHGNIVAAASSGSSPAYLDAYRYDPYGETCGSWAASSGSLTVPWRFQGRILESDIGAGTDLYDFGARAYDPDLGDFTSFDTVSGSALNPLTLNRYLYASANPETLVDPDGHANCGGAGNAAEEEACEAAAEPPSPVSQPVSHPNTELFNCSGAPASSAAECEAAKFDAQLETARAELSGSTDSTTAAYDSVLHDSVLHDTTDSGSAVYSYTSSADAAVPTTYLGETADVKRNIANENEMEHYSGQCLNGNDSACATMKTINVDYNNVSNLLGNVSTLGSSAGLCLLTGAETLGVGCTPLIGEAIYTAITAGEQLKEGPATSGRLVLAGCHNRSGGHIRDDHDGLDRAGGGGSGCSCRVRLRRDFTGGQTSTHNAQPPARFLRKWHERPLLRSRVQQDSQWRGARRLLESVDWFR